MISSDNLLFISGEQVNYSLIESKLRQYKETAGINKAFVCYSVPDSISVSKVINRKEIVSEANLKLLHKERNIEEILEESQNFIENKIFDTQIINVYKEKESSDILICTISEDIVNNLLKLSKHLKLKPLILENELAGYLRLTDRYKVEGNVAILDMGDTVTKIYSCYEGSVTSMDCINFGVSNLEDLYKEYFDITKKEAFDRLLHEGINDIAEKYINDKFIEKLSDKFNGMISTGYISIYYKSGGGWSIPGMQECIENHMNIKFTGLPMGDFEIFDLSEGQKAIFSNAYALSLRGGI